MGFSSFSSNGLARAFSVTETRLLPVGFLLPPKWENSLSQKRFSQYSRSFEKVMSSGGGQHGVSQTGTATRDIEERGEEKRAVFRRFFPLVGENVQPVTGNLVDYAGHMECPVRNI